MACLPTLSDLAHPLSTSCPTSPSSASFQPSVEDNKYVTSSVALALRVSASIQVSDVAVAVLDSEAGKAEAEAM